MPNQKKIAQVQSLTEILEKNPNFVLVKYLNASHQTLENLRKTIKKTGGKVKVIKNSLFEKALQQLAKKDELFSQGEKNLPLKESNFLLSFSEKWSQGLTAFYQILKEQKIFNFRFGCLDGQWYNEEKLTQIAQLPSSDQIIASIISSLKNPMKRFVYGLKFNPQKLIYVLKKGGEKNG